MDGWMDVRLYTVYKTKYRLNGGWEGPVFGETHEWGFNVYRPARDQCMFYVCCGASTNSCRTCDVWVISCHTRRRSGLRAPPSVFALSCTLRIQAISYLTVDGNPLLWWKCIFNLSLFFWMLNHSFSSGASIPSEAMMQFPPCFKSPPISEIFIRLRRKFSRFYLLREQISIFIHKNFWWPFLVIDHKFEISLSIFVLSAQFPLSRPNL